jgi:chromosome segregation ATPase
MTDFLAWLGPGAFLLALGGIIKFSVDNAGHKTAVVNLQKTLDSEAQGRQKEVDRLEKRIEAYERTNKEQHDAFARNEGDIRELKVIVNYVKTTLDRLVQMVEALERRRENDR